MKVQASVLLMLIAGSAFAEPEFSATPTSVIELIQKKNYDAFVEQMQGDPNQPDSKGRLPLVEAVKTRHIKFVDALLQFFAMVQVKEPASGASPAHFAFQGGLVDIARLLCAYGADLNVTDKNGRRPRDFTPTSELKEVIKLWDEKGALGFEDAPGQWVKSKNNNGEPYWYNVESSVARWNMPPSAAWQRVKYQGHPSHYVNQVTGQTVFHIPPALSWRKVKQKGKEPMWYNWAVNISQLEVPDELPEELLNEAEKDMFNVRWFNEVTREFSWVDPKYHTTWREVQHEDGKVYYFNVESGESTWEIPAELAWHKVESEEHPGEFYYVNSQTKESTWEKPHHQAWELHTDDFQVAHDEEA